MEHRWNTRNSARVNVVIHTPGVGLISGKTRDISLGGAFVETAPSVTVYKNSTIRAAFPVCGKMTTFPAHVIRTTDTGFALMFTDSKPETVSALQALLETDACDRPARTSRSASTSL